MLFFSSCSLFYTWCHRFSSTASWFFQMFSIFPIFIHQYAGCCFYVVFAKSFRFFIALMFLVCAIAMLCFVWWLICCWFLSDFHWWGSPLGVRNIWNKYSVCFIRRPVYSYWAIMNTDATSIKRIPTKISYGMLIARDAKVSDFQKSGRKFPESFRNQYEIGFEGRKFPYGNFLLCITDDSFNLKKKFFLNTIWNPSRYIRWYDILLSLIITKYRDS